MKNEEKGRKTELKREKNALARMFSCVKTITFVKYDASTVHEK